MSARLRILHLTRDFPPRTRGGLSTAVAGMVRAQVDAGAGCQVLSFDDYRPKAKPGGAHPLPLAPRRDEGVTITRLGSPDDLPGARASVGDFAADIVHVHHEMLWEFGAELAQAHRAATVVTVHTLQSEQNRLRGVASTLSSASQRRALAACDVIHAPSQAVADLLRQDDPGLADRIKVASLGVDAIAEATADAGTARFAGAPFLLYVGRFADVNGFAELLESLPELFSAHSTLHAVIAGGLPGNARAEKRWRQRWQESAGTHLDRLRFCGWLPRDDLSALYARAAVLVVPSWFETFGQVLVEGMRQGTPIVTTGAGALAELVDSDSAILIAPRSAAAIAQGALQIVRDPGAAIQRAQRGKERAAGYRWDDRIGAILELYCDAAMNTL